MILTIDVGNSKTVFGLFEGKRLKKTWRAPSEERALVPQIRRFPRNLEGVIVSSVVPRLNKTIKRCRAPSVIFVTTKLKMPVRIRVKNPHSVGADRIVNAVGAYTKWGRKGSHAGLPLLIIDLGTATTFDVVTSRGDFLGGAIAPGLKIVNEALAEKCAQLPLVPLGRPKKVIGQTTAEAIRSGVFLGYLSLVEGMIARFKKKLGPRLRVIATGGLSRLIAKDCKQIEKIDPFLTLKGLRILYEWNFKASE